MVTRLTVMRRPLAFLFGGLAVALAATALAAPGGPAPTTPTRPATPNPPIIVGARAVSTPSELSLPWHIPNYLDFAPATYTGGPLLYQAFVQNPADEAVTTTLTVSAGPRKVASVPVSVPAKATVAVAFQDDAGLGNACHDATHRLTLETGGAGGAKWLRTTPKCTLEAKTVDPSAQVPPDTRAAQRANRVYLASQSLAAGPSCDAPLSFTATIHNGSPDWAKTGLAIEGPVSTAEPLGTAIKPGWTTSPHGVSVVFDGRVGDYRLLARSDAPTYNAGWYAKVTAPRCELRVALQ